MAKWIIPFEGKLLVESDSEVSAREVANTFFAAKGLSGAKAKTYGCEKLDEAMVVIDPNNQPADISHLVGV